MRRTGSSASANRISRALEAAEQVRRHGKARAFDALEQERRSAHLVDATLNLGRLQVRIDLALDAYELACPLERLHALARAVKSHRCCLSARGSAREQS